MAKIFLYVMQDEEGWIGQALAEDGSALVQERLDNPIYARHELGVLSRKHHPEYADHYPEDYELIDLTQKDVSDLYHHREFLQALNRNALATQAEHMEISPDEIGG